MKHIYTVTGMTCNGCKTKVESSLIAIEQVENVLIDLEKDQVEVTMDEHIALSALQIALPEKYIILKTKETNVFHTVSKEEPKEWKQSLPLFPIFGYLLIVNHKVWNWNEFMLDFIGLFYSVFCFFKLLDLKGFPKSFRMYDPLVKVFPTMALMMLTKLYIG